MIDLSELKIIVSPSKKSINNLTPIEKELFISIPLDISTKIYDSLFGKCNSIATMLHIIPDKILVDYIKLLVVDEVVRRYNPKISSIYNIKIVIDGQDEVDVIVGYNEKEKKIMF